MLHAWIIIYSCTSNSGKNTICFCMAPRSIIQTESKTLQIKPGQMPNSPGEPLYSTLWQPLEDSLPRCRNRAVSTWASPFANSSVLRWRFRVGRNSASFGIGYRSRVTCFALLVCLLLGPFSEMKKKSGERFWGDGICSKASSCILWSDLCFCLLLGDAFPVVFEWFDVFLKRFCSMFGQFKGCFDRDLM